MRQSTAKDLAQALFEEAGDALFLFDPDTDQILDVNPLAERLSGFGRAELLTFQATYLFRFGAGGSGGKQRLQQAAAKTSVFHAQDGFLLRTREDGVWIPVNVTVTRLHLQPRTLALITIRDMREQFEATQRLQRMEAELRRVLAAVSDCLWSAEWTGEGKWIYRYLSPVVESLAGRPAAHFLTDLNRWQEVVHPEDRPAWQASLRRLRSGQPSQVEYRVVWPDGSVRWLRESVRVARRPDGQTLQLDGILTDFSERKQADARLQEERLLLRTLMEALPETIYFKDAQGAYLVDNAAHRDLLGAASEDEVRGKTVFDFFPPELAERYDADDAATLAGGLPVQNLVEAIPLRTGESRLFEFTKVPLRDASGDLFGLVCIGRDVSEQREAERALAHERNLLRTVMDNLPDHIFVKDLDSRFVVANAATLDTLGVKSPDDVVGKTDFDFLPRERAEQFFANERLILETGEPMIDREELLIDAGGTARWLATTKVPLRDEAGEVVGLVGISHDISERRTMESELRRAVGAAEAASKAKGEFLARMSHEIRTPMGGIIGMTELALDSDLTRDQRESLQMVLASGEALLTVINDILDFSKIEAGKLQLETAAFSFRDSLADGVRSLGLRAQQKGLELACHVAPDVPDLLIGDLGRLRQVIVNLLGNAIKFTDSGEIVVHVERVAPEADDPAPLLHFEVQDTGIGISLEKHDAIFEPFEQADGSNSRKYQGTGLGLAISSQLVQLMGGRMWLDSEPGGGSRFHFTARFEVVTGQENSHGPVEPPEVHDLRVLVVDDNATHRIILREMLCNWRMCPTVVGSTPEALAELRSQATAGTPYPLLLLDAVMPDPDGFALAECLRAEPGLAGAVIIMLTPTARAASGERCRVLGIKGIVLKPIKQSELLDTILGIISSHEATKPAGVDLLAQPPSAVPSLPPLRLLLAEDAIVNQRLAVRVLEKAGHCVRVANNGVEALEALARESFDLVLMDVQMPELGGFETTQLIRQSEETSGLHLPIIALTAHAMKGDREKCLQAGMDGYVTKPIRARDLFLAMEQALQMFAPALLTGQPRSESVPSIPATKESDPMSEEFDLKEALGRCGGDADLLRELIDMFLAEIPGWMNTLEQGIQKGNADVVHRSAHTIKGAVGTFSSTKGWNAALHVEKIGKEARLAEVGPALDHMKVTITRLIEALKAYKDS